MTNPNGEIPQLSEDDQVMILGAGPCGLGSAITLQERGFDNWQLYDAKDKAGGLASTLTSEEGFLFDIGGHVLFSHYDEFDRMCDRVNPEWLEHERNATIFMRDRFVPYPLQRNFGHLPSEEVDACLQGLKQLAETNTGNEKPENFEEWLRQSFGEGLYNIFMEPYNYKVWAYPPRDMNSQWVGERVASLDPGMLDKIARKEADGSWGPNATFRYPKYGATGAIWLGLASEIDDGHLNFNKQVVKVDAQEKMVSFDDGSSRSYDFLISTMPLDQLCNIVENTNYPDLAKLSEAFKYSSTNVIGIGMSGPCPDQLKDKSWMYFPEKEVPFYRATVLSNYSPHVVPEPGKQWSLLLEVSESPDKPVGPDVLEESIDALHAIGLIPQGTEIVSQLHKRFEYGYPTPFLGRDGVVDLATGALEEHGIFSRGRFGAWKYEVSNQDHTYMQGVEIARRLMDGEVEVTYPHPEIVNDGKKH